MSRLFLKLLTWGPLLLDILRKLLLVTGGTQPGAQVHPGPDLERERQRDKELARLRRQTRRAILLAVLAILIGLGALAWVIGGRHQLPAPPPAATERY